MGIFLGPVIGLVVSWFSAKAAASTARSEPERICIVRHASGIVIFCFAMSIAWRLVLKSGRQTLPRFNLSGSCSVSSPGSPRWS
jgi:hypothetical protein